MSEKTEQPSSTVTPIKKSMKHQEEAGANEVDVDLDDFTSYDTVFNGRKTTVFHNEETGDVIIDGKLYETELEEFESHFEAQVQGNHSYKIEMHSGEIYLEGRIIEFDFTPSMPKLERRKSVKEGEKIIKAPLPGTVSEFAIEIGDYVKVGDKVLTLKAMKMQNDIMSEHEGTVEEIFVKKGDEVTDNQRLVLLSQDDKTEGDIESNDEESQNNND